VSAKNDKRSGRPSTSKTTENVEKIPELIHKDHCQLIHELADTAGISNEIFRGILTENFNVQCTAAKFIPRLFTNDQKQRRVNVSWAMREDLWGLNFYSYP
jgi:hypothetical protein